MEYIEKEIKDSIEKILKKIRETRKLKGFSHENMAFDLNISSSAYNKLERSETVLSLERLLKIKQILDLSFSDLFEIKTGDVYHQDLRDNAVGHLDLKDYSIVYQQVENLYQDNKEITEKFIKSQQEEIEFLRNLLAKNAK
jgi:transcriptional regulator with XRE-family HTH domain